MSKFISITRIQRAIINLPQWRARVHSQGATHLWHILSLKWKNVNSKRLTPFAEEDDKEFFDTFTRVQDTKYPYYDALDESFRINTHAHSNVATSRKKTFRSEWGAAKMETKKDAEYWQFNPDYLAIIRAKVLSKGGETHQVPLYDFLAWLYHSREFPDDISLEKLVQQFRDEFHLSEKEFNAIFDEASFDGLPESDNEFFVDHAVPPGMLLALLNEKGDFDVAEALESLQGSDPQSVELDDAVMLAREGRKQLIIQGPPGTSKTYMARQISAALLNADEETISDRAALSEFLRERQFSTLIEKVKDSINPVTQDLVDAIDANDGTWDIVQFHPSYTYEDFVRGISAKLPEGGGAPVFEVENRIFGVLADVSSYVTSPVILIIDEINRGDLSKVLGELVYALEYRGEAVRTPYVVNGSALLSVGNNFHLLATMNTADRSIALIDYAIRRRFDFVDLLPDQKILAAHIERAELTKYKERILELYNAISGLFSNQRDFAVGHTYFMGDSAADVARRVIFQVLPLLAEYQKERILDEHLTIRLTGWPGKSGLPITHPKPFEMTQYLQDWLEGGTTVADTGEEEDVDNEGTGEEA